ncbi:NAD(P)-dependent oxidoreductase [Humidisolicoccus flavus]|uniref:NAD(P)-dependent oxidoreductase n=1 Tax=Humidisolicoccus flavus TaxID=3111414 RepID=UPI00324E9D1C
MTITVTIPYAAQHERLKRARPDVQWHLWHPAEPPVVAEADLVVLPYMEAATSLEGLPKIKTGVVQAPSLGVDGMQEMVPNGAVLCNAKGVHEAPTAELGLALILAAQRKVPAMVQSQSQRQWEQFFAPSLISRSVLIFGAGGVANELAKRLIASDAKVLRAARSARTDEYGEILESSDARARLGEFDIVVLVVPLNEQTTHLADASFFAAMRDDALLVNIARGPVVETNALVDALNSGRIRAVLDVTDPEPLPSEHPLWSAPGLLISPHLGGRVDHLDASLDALILDQVERIESGRELWAVVES